MKDVTNIWFQRTSTDRTNMAIGLCKFAVGLGLGVYGLRITPVATSIIGGLAVGIWDLITSTGNQPSQPRRFGCIPLVRGLQIVGLVGMVRLYCRTLPRFNALYLEHLGAPPAIDFTKLSSILERLKWDFTASIKIREFPDLFRAMNLNAMALGGVFFTAIFGGLTSIACTPGHGTNGDNRGAMRRWVDA